MLVHEVFVHHFRLPRRGEEMMHKNFMHRHLRIFVVQCSRMKFYANGVIVSTSTFRRERSAAKTRRVFSQEMPISLTSSAVFAPVM